MKTQACLSRRVVASAVVGLAATVALTACGGATRPHESAVIRSLSAAPATGAQDAGPAATGASTTVAVSTPRCRTSGLRVIRRIPPGNGYAGGHAETLVFTNTSSGTCSLAGFPGVSFVAGAHGTQVNRPFRRTTGEAPRTVTLRPHQSAYTYLLVATLDHFSHCRPVAVRGYRVYPPNSRTSVFVKAPQDACSTTGVGIPQVGPVALGVGN